MNEKIKHFYDSLGLPRLIIITFLLILLIAAFFLDVSVPALLGRSDVGECMLS